MSNTYYVDLMPVRLSVHLDERRLQEIAGKYLSALFGREIMASYERREYYHWGFNISGTPLSKEEIGKLFLAAGADDFDRNSNDFGEYPITEINQGLAEKMLTDELPFIPDSSHADNEGVWFFGPPESKMIDILVYYPETDLAPDLFRFSMKDGTSPDDLISCFYETVREIVGDQEDEAEDTDRLSKISDVISGVIEMTGCKAISLSMLYEAEIV